MLAVSLSSFTLLSVLAASSQLVGADQVYYASAAYEAGDYGVSPVQSFVSAPNLEPPAINFLTAPTSAVDGNYTFLAFRGTDAPQLAPLIYDNNGSLIWSGAAFGASMDTIVQTYKGEQVLTFFNGSFHSGGYGTGQWLMLNSSYDVIKTVDMYNMTAMSADFHEFVITDNNTALIESWVLTQADLSSLNGSTEGWTWDCRFQEVDLESDTLLFEWNSLDHVPVSETYFTISDDAGNSSTNAFDYCHINSLTKDASGNYLVSMRGPSTLYSISATTGEILWRLHGKSGNFSMGTGSEFWYQHDARFMSPITSSPFNVSLFDNANGGGTDVETTARGIVISVDTDAMTVTLVKEFIPSFNHTAASQGSMQPLENGNYLVGWGAECYYTEYAPDGTIIMDAHFGALSSDTESYRALKMAWTGHPSTLPSFGLNSTAGTSGYASWNGATEVVTWSLIGGSSIAAMTSISNVTRSGFETELPVTATYAYLSAAALSSNGTCLGVTEVYSVTSQSSTGTIGSCPSGAAASSSTNSSSSSSTSKSGAPRHTSAASIVGAILSAIAVATLA